MQTDETTRYKITQYHETSIENQQQFYKKTMLVHEIDSLENHLKSLKEDHPTLI